MNRQTLGVMQLRTEVGDIARLVGAEQEHAGQWRNSELADLLAEKHLGLHVQRAVLARRQHHAIGAGGARRIEQRVDHQVAPISLRPLDPEFAEPRELLAHWQCRVDRQPARGEPVPLALADDAEVAGAEQGHHLVLLVLLVQRIEHLEAGEAQSLQRGRVDVDTAELEHRRVVANLAHFRRGDFIDAHRRVEVHALVIELQMERGFDVLPVGMLRVEAHALVVGECHLAEFVGQVAHRLLVTAGSQFLSPLGHIVEAERQRTAGHQHAQATRQTGQHARRLIPRVPLKNA